MSAVADLDLIADVARRARLLVIETVAHAGAGHVGGPLSAADLLAALYFDVLDVRPDEPRWPDRDRFILSKGHSSLGLYSVLALRGFFEVKELKTFDRLDSRLQGHPDMSRLDALDMSTGALGQGLSPGIGMALAARLQGREYHTFVMLGDGELQEGQVWEAAFIAARYRLGNLTAIVDWNGLQQYGWRAEKGRRPPFDEINPARVFEAFGWASAEIDGHELAQIVPALRAAKEPRERPLAIVARTIKGKGVSFMENEFTWHSRVPTAAELEQARAELAAAPAGTGGSA